MTLIGGAGCCSDVDGHPEEDETAAQGFCTRGSDVAGGGEGFGKNPDGFLDRDLNGFFSILRIFFTRSCALFPSGIAQMFARGVWSQVRSW